MDAILEERPDGVHVVCGECGTTITSFTFKKKLSLVQEQVETHYQQAKHKERKTNGS